ncbi:MAG TPA: Gfo/Idh/MocA family oxidoreductase [Acidimicrobiales bacterium]|jgi:predicted dehydrogenase|nr:Gfo/Idh/MocA family oxidoreductase [Acidimicrobiales bacterium]
METVRWGILATGGIARRFVRAMEHVPGGTLHAVASRSAERAAEFASMAGARRAYGTYEELAADPDVDAVYVATPHPRHEPDTLMCIEAGKHVMCEKPFALNAQQAERMIGAARHRGTFLMEAIWSRFLPAYARMGEVLASGRIGEPVLVEADFGFRAPFNPDHRLFAADLGGGALLDLGIYPLQLCSLVLGEPIGVSAQAVKGVTGVDEHVAAVVRYAGGLGVIKAATRVAMSCQARISGTEGWIGLPAFMHCPDHLTVTVGGETERIDAGFEGDGLQFEIIEAQRCLAAGLNESPGITLDQTLSLARTMDRIRAQIGVVYPGEEPLS